MRGLHQNKREIFRNYQELAVTFGKILAYLVVLFYR